MTRSSDKRDARTFYGSCICCWRVTDLIRGASLRCADCVEHAREGCRSREAETTQTTGIPAARRYTAYARWPEDDADGEALDAEELDVDAADASTAHAIADALLQRDYRPGGRITRVVERFGMYL